MGERAARVAWQAKAGEVFFYTAVWVALGAAICARCLCVSQREKNEQIFL